MTAVVDYGVGNLYSLCSSLRFLGIESEVSDSPAVLRRADRLILPGVGAFGDAMDRLMETGLAAAIRTEAEKGKPLLGVCLGMQLLFSRGLEFGEHRGLGLIPGEVASLEQDLRKGGFDYKIPQMGWNPLLLRQPECPLLRYVKEGDSMYYVHSFYAKECDAFTAAVGEYGVTVPGVVWNGRVFGTQFHPEKSGDKGLRILRAFAEVC